MAGKRGNKEGLIRKRTDGRWEARLSLPDGTQKSFYGKTQREAERKLFEARQELEKGLPLTDGTQTVKQYLLSWLEMMGPRVRPSTIRRYRAQVLLHLIPGLGHILLGKLTAQQVQLFYAKKVKEGLSPTTVNHIHGVLHHAIDDAKRMQLLYRNVTELVQPPRRLRSKPNVLTSEQARKLIKFVKGNRYEALYILAVTTGMREGELLALHWSDIDWAHCSLQLHHALQETENHSSYTISDPKTAFSRRRIALTQIAVDALKTHQARLAEEKTKLGEAWDDTYDLVFPNTLGRILRPSTLADDLFPRILLAAELPKIRFHDLRHTAATLLLSQGIHPKIVSEMLGHSSISITLNVYSHVTPHMQQQAADAMESMMTQEDN